MSRFAVMGLALVALLCFSAAWSVQSAVVEEQDSLSPSAPAAGVMDASLLDVGAGCSNIPPNPAPGKTFYNCAAQKSYGKCSEKWMTGSGHCMRTCGKCSAPCRETAPDKNSCAAQAGWGKVSGAEPRTNASRTIRQKFLCRVRQSLILTSDFFFAFLCAVRLQLDEGSLRLHLRSPRR